MSRSGNVWVRGCVCSSFRWIVANMPCKIHNAFLAVTLMCGTLVLGLGIEPMNLALEADVLTTGTPGKSHDIFKIIFVCSNENIPGN